MTATDVVYSILAQAGLYSGFASAMLDVGWFSCVCCAAFAGTHPSAVELGRPDAVPRSAAPTVRRLAITGGALLTPVLLPAARAIQDHTSISISAAAAGVVLIGLVTLRVSRLAQAGTRWEHTADAQQAYYRAMAKHSSDAVIVLTRSGHVRDTSPSIEAVIGHPSASMLGLDVAELIHPNDLETGRASMAAVNRSSGTTLAFEARLRQIDDSYRWFEIRLTSLVDDPAVRGGDRQPPRRERPEVLRGRSAPPGLSRCVDRPAEPGPVLQPHEPRPEPRSARRGEEIAVLFCDLDGFKHVNDSFGHGAGDVVLQTISERLRLITRGEDTVARSRRRRVRRAPRRRSRQRSSH